MSTRYQTAVTVAMNYYYKKIFILINFSIILRVNNICEIHVCVHVQVMMK